MPGPSFETDEITASDAAGGFSSGKVPLDEFFAGQAWSNHARGLGKTFVLRRPAGETSLPALVGFYTLCMSSIPRERLARAPRKTRTNVPREVPVALVGRLAVDARAQHRRFGERLLVDAFRRVLASADNVGCAGVLVDAKDDGAVAFYARYGFIDLDPAAAFPRAMLIAIDTVRSAAK